MRSLRSLRSLTTFVLLALLGAIAALLLSNTTPVALTFLGVTSLALPLAVWIGAALLAGAATGLWFLILFRLAERRGAKREREQRRAEFGPDDFAVINEERERREAGSAYAGAYADAYADTPVGTADVRGYGSPDYGSPDYGSPDYGAKDDRSPGYGPGNYRTGGDGEGEYGAEDYRDYADGYADRYADRYPNDASEERGAVYRDSEVGSRERRPSEFVPEPLELENRGDRRSPEAEFEVVEASSPVYDASYRVIQPPRRDQSGSYADEPYADEPYAGESGTAEAYAARRAEGAAERGDRHNSTQAPSQRSTSKPQRETALNDAQDDWDIESDLDW